MGDENHVLGRVGLEMIADFKVGARLDHCKFSTINII